MKLLQEWAMLVESLNGVNPNAASATSPASDMGAIGKIEEFFQEQWDRKLKKNNFIVFNSPESATDVDTIMSVISSCTQNSNCPQEDIKVFRLGKHINNKCRLIRVICKNTEIARSVIVNSRKLNSCPNLKHISVSDDKTLRQLKEYQDLKKQLAYRISAGESNLKIVYRNGASRIITINRQPLNS